jgi:uncharacterized repeat protein (TIGR04076 family)
VAGIGAWTPDSVALRIVYDDNQSCPNGHKTGQQYVLDKTVYQAHAEQFYRLFPEVLIKCLGNIPINTATQHYALRRGARVAVFDVVFPCRYHPRKDNTPLTALLPDGFCPHVFWAIYPHVLALMYNARVDKEVTVNHPGQTGQITLSLEKSPRPARALGRLPLTLTKTVLQRLGYPKDWLDYALTITVRSNNTESCPLTVDKRYPVNIRNPQFLCPASFQALYPYLLLTATDTPLPWNDAPNPPRICCPDCAGTIYRLC